MPSKRVSVDVEVLVAGLTDVQEALLPVVIIFIHLLNDQDETGLVGRVIRTQRPPTSIQDVSIHRRREKNRREEEK